MPESLKDILKRDEPQFERNDAGKLTRAGMESVLQRGGSVLFNSRTISRLDQLPSEAEVAKGDADQERAARSRLKERQRALDEEMAILNGKTPVTETGKKSAVTRTDGRDSLVTGTRTDEHIPSELPTGAPTGTSGPSGTSK